jgi:hypothetical protein
MSKFHDKAEAQTKQIIGQMLGDELLVREGQEQFDQARQSPATPIRGSFATNAGRSSPGTRSAPSG